MLYYFKKGKNTAEVQKKICAVYGEGAVTDRMCHKWFAKFCAGDFSLDDPPWSDQLKLMVISPDTENNQHCSTWEVANILKIPKSLKSL